MVPHVCHTKKAQNLPVVLTLGQQDKNYVKSNMHLIAVNRRN